jgi:CDP-diacylglycerol--glycerol-3-phosphate 3-phosphatidyltransferase
MKNLPKIRELRVWLHGIPNKLTFARILAVPIIMLLYPIDFYPLRVFVALLFLAAAITDWLDGYLARRYNMETPLGALLDPIADKMLVITGLLCLFLSEHRLYLWFAAPLVCREIAISGLRLLALEKNYTLAVNTFGKWKTGFQVAAIFLLMLKRPVFDFPISQAGWICLSIALFLSLYSALIYVQSFWANVKDELTA